MLSTLTRSSLIAAALAASLVSAAHAAPPTVRTATTEVDPAAPEQALPPAPPLLTEHDRHMRGARFSTKRMLLEILAGAVVGSVAAYATFEATCSDGSDCFGASLAAAGVNFAITPLAIWGAGRLAGGEGTLGWSYLGASVALAPFGVTGSAGESASESLGRFELELAVSTILLPVTSALCFEMSSQLGYQRWRASAQEHGLSLGITPVNSRHGVEGAMGHVGWRF